MKRFISSFLSVTAVTMVIASGCGSKEGGEGEDCYANGTCDGGLVCLSKTCVDPSPDATSDGSTSTESTGPLVDFDACFACGDDACPDEREACDAKNGCTKLLECSLGCGTDASCSSSCTVPGTSAQDLAAAATAVSAYVTCSVTSCRDDCSVQVEGTTATTSNATTGSSGDVLAACLDCGETACPTETADCKDKAGCTDVLDCSFSCDADDSTCAQDCLDALPESQRTAALTSMTTLLACTVTECLSECSAGDDTGTTDSTTESTTDSTTESTTDSTTESTTDSTTESTTDSTTSDPDPPEGAELFTGSGVGIDVPDYNALGSFFILEDSVKDGSLVVDSLTHTDLDAVDSADEPSTFETSLAPCVSGMIAAVTDPDGYSCQTSSSSCAWENLWGGGIGLSLNEPDGSALAWDAEAVGVQGFKFSTTGYASGIPLRFYVEDTDGEQYCAEISIGSTTTLQFSDLEHECWEPTAKQLDPTKIKQISWQFAPDASYSYPIDDFCVTALSAVE